MPLELAYPLNALLMIAIPISLGFFLKRRFQLAWGLWWIGAATFILSQVGHIPFNAGLTALFNRGLLPTPPQSWNPVFNAIVLGLSAGLWEELSRYAVFRWWARDARTWRKAVWLGAGHGGIEATLLGILVLVNFFYLMAMRNADLTSLVPANQLALAQNQIAAYWSAPWYLILLGALERLFTQPVQICFSVLVVQSFLRKRSYWVWLAVLWHALVDAAAVYTLQRAGPYVAEAVVGAACLLSLVIIFSLRSPEPEEEIAPEPLQPSTVERLIANNPIETPEKLDQTRYQ